MKAKLRVVVIAVAVIGLASWWLLRQGEPNGAVVASGTVEATESDLGFQVTGRIEEIASREGDRVEQGDLLAWLDRRELEAERASYQAAVEVARARLAELEHGSRRQDVARAEAAVRAARESLAERVRDAERSHRLYESGAVSREAMERARTGEAVARASLDEAEEALALVREGPRAEQVAAQRAQLRQAEAALARADVGLDRAGIVAPFGGVVALRHREPGETAGAGAPVLTLRNMEDRWVRIYVPGDMIGRVQLGQRAEIRGDTHPDRRYAGEVFFIGSEAEFTPRNVQTAEERTRLVYPVRVRITDDPAVDLKPGLPVDVRLFESDP